MKQIYKITYPTGKIYIGKDSFGSHRYFGSPDMNIINADFNSLQKKLNLITLSENKFFGNLRTQQKKNFLKRRWSILNNFNPMTLKLDIINGQNTNPNKIHFDNIKHLNK